MIKPLRVSLVLFSVTACISLTAQDKLFTAADFLNRDLQPKSISNLAWRGNTDAFTWIENNCLIQKNAQDPTVADTLLSLVRLNDLLKELKQPGESFFPQVTWIDDNKLFFQEGIRIYLLDLDKLKLTIANQTEEKAENLTIETKNLNAAYTVGNNLFVAARGNIIQATDEKNSGIVYGQIPSRNEFGIDAGMYWSPDGKRLAFYRIDQTEVTDYPQVNIYNRIAVPDPEKYPMAGMKSQKVRLGIFDPSQNEIVYLQTDGPENQYLTSVTWDPSGKYIYTGILNRDQDHLVMNKYETSTGRLVKTLFEERNDRYVEPMHGLFFLKSDQGKFIWQSRRDGWNHLYLYDTEGTLIKQLTRGKWEVTDLIGTDPRGLAVFYESTMESPLESHLYKAEVKNGKTEKITAGDGIHSIRASGSMNYFIDILNSINIARAYYLIDSRGTRLAALLEDVNPYREYKTGELSIFSIKADDGSTDLYCRMIKPVDFNRGKRYPVIIYVYGGPHAQLINKSWTGGAGFFLNYLAQQGYLVFTLDNRGSANRGFDFESVIHRQLGEKEIADQMAGVRYLKSLPYVDSTRIGINGWSYGGFMTVSLMTRNPGVFKVAVAGGPVIDWKWYEVMYGERYMDTPMKNPDGYEKSSLMNYAGNLSGRLLIIHGTNDPTVVWQNSLSFLDECIKKGRQIDYFVYPGAGHNMTGRARIHLFEKMAGYFNDFL